MLWYPPHFGELLLVEVEADAGDDYFDKMILANASTVDWALGKMDTGTYLDILEYCLETDPVNFVQPVIDLYLPESDPI